MTTIIKSPIKKFRVGLIGLGNQSMNDHLPAISASLDVELVGVADIDEVKLTSFSEKIAGVSTYINYEDLLRLEKPDFVIIAVPHYLHYEIVKKVIAQGIHILKEKPFATSLDQVKELKKLSEDKGVKISLTLQRRFNPIYLTFFQLIDKIGKPYFIDARYTFFTDSPQGGWRGKKELAGGGCLIDMGYHIIDLLMWYFGLPDTISAESSCEAKEEDIYNAEDTAQVLFRYSKENIFGSLLVSRVIPPKTEYFDVYGTRGIIHIERGKIERRSPSGDVQESLSREQHWPSAAQDQIEHFLKIIQNQRENVTGPDFNFNHLAFIEAAYQSKSSGKFTNPNKLLFHEKFTK